MVSINLTNFLTIGFMAALFFVLLNWVTGLVGIKIPGMA